MGLSYAGERRSVRLKGALRNVVNGEIYAEAARLGPA